MGAGEALEAGVGRDGVDGDGWVEGVVEEGYGEAKGASCAVSIADGEAAPFGGLAVWDASHARASSESSGTSIILLPPKSV